MPNDVGIQLPGHEQIVCYLWSKIGDLDTLVPRQMDALAVPCTFVIWVEVQSKPDILRLLGRLFSGKCILDNDKPTFQELVDLFLYSPCFIIWVLTGRRQGHTREIFKFSGHDFDILSAITWYNEMGRNAQGSW